MAEHGRVHDTEIRVTLHSAGRPRTPPLSEIVAGAVGGSAAGTRLAARMHDISQTGIRIETSHALSPGAELCVEIDFIGTKLATVAWQRGSIYGCDFATPLRHADAARAMEATPVIRLAGKTPARPWPLLASFAAMAVTAVSSWWMMPGR